MWAYRASCSRDRLNPSAWPQKRSSRAAARPRFFPVSTASRTSNGGTIRSNTVPLALGGAPEDLRNVWPEPKAEAKRKDEVEDALLAAACYRRTISLQATQVAIARDWTATPVGLPAIREHYYAEDER